MESGLLKRYKFRPNKRLGQNFLVSKIVLEKIIKAGELKSSDIVLEIGPGLGTLTKELAKKVKKVIAVEKDENLANILKRELDNGQIKNIQIINQDILKFQVSSFKLKKRHLSVVCRLPSRVIGHCNSPDLSVVFSTVGLQIHPWSAL